MNKRQTVRDVATVMKGLPSLRRFFFFTCFFISNEAFKYNFNACGFSGNIKTFKHAKLEHSMHTSTDGNLE